MRLVSVYDVPEAKKILFDLLREREPHQNISHKVMPTWDEHCAFVDGQPYMAWFLIKCEGDFVGAIYLTRAREVGLFLFEAHQGKGYGRAALERLRDKHPGRLLANVSVHNDKSIAFFLAQGFTKLQLTLESADAESQ